MIFSFLYFLISGLPSDKAWGKTKKLFYDADVKDDDIFGKMQILLLLDILQILS